MDGYQHELEVFNNTHTQAHRCRKALGGGMRQAGILAAAGILSLSKGPTRVAQDHIFTKQLVNWLLLRKRFAESTEKEVHGIGQDIRWLAYPMTETNIIIVVHCSNPPEDINLAQDK
ncbi:uncharacterized protein R102.4-like [Daphnia pulex]|uniref:uncharacterized protein R102.4-like n=1 Tax=Daphnia pulex TaxID=6669 RepID=UPI001EDE1623|nr:uncharacterized protein R102.4-like [Daphnia pulex]XP_046451483.1 uncharacterized protein R102.4-like [Daphnia pulex]XP_046640193.1 uncharacterized protein R102.4-like [Daphnia pulicaria]